MRVRIVDPSAYTPPYDHALCDALAAAGVDVALATSARGARMPAEDVFYGGARSLRGKLARHVRDMRAEARRPADLTHYQWLAVQHVDGWLLPRDRPVVLTAHDILPREPRPGQRAAQRRLYGRVDAIIVHSEHGRARLLEEAGADPAKIRVIRHGAFTRYLDVEPRLPRELAGSGAAGAGGDRERKGTVPLLSRERPVVLFFGLIRPYKGLDVLLDAWRRAAPDAELWVVGQPRGVALPATLPPGVRIVPRFVDNAELAAVFRAADVAVLPYRQIDQSGVLFTALAFGVPLLLSDAGGFPELRGAGAEIVARGDADALAAGLRALLADRARRAQLAEQARAAAAGPYAWETIAKATIELYEELIQR